MNLVGDASEALDVVGGKCTLGYFGLGRRWFFGLAFFHRLLVVGGWRWSEGRQDWMGFNIQDWWVEVCRTRNLPCTVRSTFLLRKKEFS